MLKGLVRTTTCTLFAVASSHSRLLAFNLSRNKGYQNILGYAYQSPNKIRRAKYLFVMLSKNDVFFYSWELRIGHHFGLQPFQK
jgi:hypothetical protein